MSLEWRAFPESAFRTSYGARKAPRRRVVKGKFPKEKDRSQSRSLGGCSRTEALRRRRLEREALFRLENLLHEEAGSRLEAIAIGALSDREHGLGCLQIQLCRKQP